MITSELSIIWNINYDRWPLVTLVTAPPWSPLLLSALGHSILGWLLTTNNKKALSDTLWSSEVDIMLALETHWLCWSGGQWLRTQWWHPRAAVFGRYYHHGVSPNQASQCQNQICISSPAAVSSSLSSHPTIWTDNSLSRLQQTLDLSLLTTNTRALQARESGK